MLRFIVGTAVRTATRAAIRSHRESQAEREAEQRAAQMSGPFALTHDPTGESALFEDRRAGFSHALPGYPRAVHPGGAPGEPAADAAVAIGELPVVVRYRYDQPQIQAADALDYAIRAAQGYATNRTGACPNVAAARADQASRWAVEAAAMVSYALPQPDPWGADFEELFVLVRRATAMAVTLRYPRAQMDWLRQALFASVARNSLLWDPERFRYPPRIWPESAFLEPSINAVLTPHKNGVVPQIAPALGALAPEEKEALSAVLGAIMQREEPPWAPLPPHAIGEHLGALLGCSQSPAYQRIVHQACGEARNMHDLRGLCVLLGRAIS